MVREGWNGFNVLHTAASRVGGLDIGFVPGSGGRDRDGDPRRLRERRDRGGLSARRRRDRHEAARPRLRRLSGPSRRCRRAARRCRAARRRLYREGRHLRQYRRPHPGGAPRDLPAGRRARGLGDPARPLRGAGAQAALRLPGAAPPPPDRVPTRTSSRSTRSSSRNGDRSARRGASSRRRSPIPSPISTSPTRSAAPRRPWRSAARPIGRRMRRQRRQAQMAEFLNARLARRLADHSDRPRDPGDHRAAARRRRLPHLCRAQGAGGGAAAQGTQRRRAVRAVAAARRRRSSC